MVDSWTVHQTLGFLADTWCNWLSVLGAPVLLWLLGRLGVLRWPNPRVFVLVLFLVSSLGVVGLGQITAMRAKALYEMAVIEHISAAHEFTSAYRDYCGPGAVEDKQRRADAAALLRNWGWMDRHTHQPIQLKPDQPVPCGVDGPAPQLHTGIPVNKGLYGKHSVTLAFESVAGTVLELVGLGVAMWSALLLILFVGRANWRALFVRRPFGSVR